MIKPIDAFPFTSSAVVASANHQILENSPPIGLVNEGAINTGDGDDQLDVTGDSGGIQNEGVINTGAGNDQILASGSGIWGLLNNGAVNTGIGDDLISGKASRLYGILNNGILSTGLGNDTILGSITSAGAGILNQDTLYTGGGDDQITGTSTGFASLGGIFNYSVIDTGAGNDTISGSGAGRGIYNPTFSTETGSYEGTIDTGAGNDQIIAVSEKVGIEGGIINTGSGDDIVTTSGGEIDLAANVSLDLGDGKDVLSGFGDATANGGEGEDTLVLPGLRSDYTIALSSAVPTGINFTRLDATGDIAITLYTQQFEIFLFKDEKFTLAEFGASIP